MRPRRRLAAIAVAAVALAAVPAVPACAAAPGAASFVVAPDHAGLLGRGSSLGLTVAITNAGPAALPAGRVALAFGPASSDASTLLTEIQHPAAALQGLFALRAATPAVAPGSTARVRVTVPKTIVDSLVGASTGAHPLYAEVDAGSQRLFANTAVTRIAPGFAGHVALGTVVPLTAPRNATGVVDPTTVAALTAPGGAWTRALEAAEAAPDATLALDPEVVASLRLAASADVLGRLERLRNEVVRLPYGDSDLTLERAAGAGTALAPTSFAGGVLGTATPTPTPTPTGAPSPAPTTPTTRDLLRWPVSSTLAWPVPGTASTADLGFFRASGLDTTLLAAGDIRDGATRLARGPHVTVGGRSALVADTAASTLLDRAAQPGVAGSTALADLVAVLGTDAAVGSPAVLAVAGRAPVPDGLAKVLQTLGQQAWIQGTSLKALGRLPGTPVALRSGSVPASRTTTARGLLDAEADVRRLGTIVPPGTSGRITGPARLAVLGLLSTAWRGDDGAWRAAAADTERTFTGIVRQVRIADTSPVNYVGGSGNLPVKIVNQLPEPVTVVVKGISSNGRLRVEGDRTVTIPALSQGNATLPIKSISNGQVELTLELTTPGGALLGPPKVVPITVNAGWEPVAAVVLVIALLALFGTGVYRNVRRARRKLRSRSG